MRIDPVLADLASDPGRLAQECAALETAWRDVCNHPATTMLLAELAMHGEGAAIRNLPALQNLTASGEGAADLLAPVVAAMRTAALGQLRLPHFAGPAMQSLTLAMRGRSSLSLAVIDADAWRALGIGIPGRATFNGGELDLVILGGSGSARKVFRTAGQPECRTVRLQPGTCIALDGAREALIFDRLDGGSLAFLRLFRRSARPQAVEEVDIVTGQVLHRAAARQSDSRIAVAMALLGRMERREAAPLMAEIAGEGDPALRWQALRECLALDTATGFAALLSAASRPGDVLAASAARLATELVHRHPELAVLQETPRCPA